MSQKPALVPGAGWRVADAAAVAPLCNLCNSRIAGADVSHAVVLRRLRLLSAMIAETANAAFERDPEAEGEAIADGFWQRRAAGERGEADDA